MPGEDAQRNALISKNERLMREHAKPIEGPELHCVFPVWIRGGCRGRVRFVVDDRTYCAGHARIRVVHLYAKDS